MSIISFWQRIRSLLKEKKLTQLEAAKACGVPYSTFRKWITQNVIPPLDVASSIARYLGISLDYLAFGKKEDFNLKISELLDSLHKTSEKLETVLRKHP